MRRRAGLALLLALLMGGIAQAEQVVCGDTTQFQRLYSSDPTKVTDATCTVHPKPTSQAQRDAQEAQRVLAETFQAAGTLRYLKVVDGWIVEKTQAEKDAVDAALAAQEALAVQYQQELTTQDLCSPVLLQQITDAVQAQHDSLAATIQQQHDDNAAAITAIAAVNLTTFKAALNTINNSMAQGLGVLNDRLATSVSKLARCIRAARGAH